MIRLYRIYSIRPRRVLAYATAYFGPDGLDMVPVRSSPDSVTFESGDGFVSVEALPAGIRELESRVAIAAREWERQAKTFMDHLGCAEVDPGEDSTATR